MRKVGMTNTDILVTLEGSSFCLHSNALLGVS